MSNIKFKDAKDSDSIAAVARRSEHTILGIWAADCAERVLHYFEGANPADGRPRQAIEALRQWVRTGEFRMARIRGASLAAHAAAREAEEDSSARFAARSAGQAVATAHVKTHSIGAAWYAAKAVWAAHPKSRDTYVARERDWQLMRLIELRSSPKAMRHKKRKG